MRLTTFKYEIKTFARSQRWRWGKSAFRKSPPETECIFRWNVLRRYLQSWIWHRMGFQWAVPIQRNSEKKRKKMVCVLEFKSEFRFAGARLPVIETDAESKSTIWIKSLIATRIRLEYRFVGSDHLCFGQQVPDLWNFGRDCYRCDGNPSRIGRSR